MNIEDFKKLSVDDALQAAGQFAGTDATVFDGLWRAESARGKNMRSPAGAEGHFQLMPKTRKALEKKLGVSIDPYNFHEALYGAMNHLKDDLIREGGDVVNALRAYNNGPNWRNQADPRGENAAYAQRVLGPAAPSTSAVGAAAPAAAPNATTSLERPLAGLSTPMPERSAPADKAGFPKTMAAAAAAGQFGSLAGMPQVSGNPVLSQAESASRAAVAAETERAGMDFIDTARAQFMHTGIIGAALKSASRQEFTDDPAWVVPESAIAGMSEDDQKYLLQSNSREEFDRLKDELEWEKEDLRKASLNGTGYMVAAGIFAGLPEGYITGIGAAKAMAMVGKGAMQAAQAGKYGSAVGRAIVENVGGNVASALAEDLITDRVSGMDYAVQALVGVPFAGIDAIHLRGVALDAHAKAAVDKAIQRQVEIADQAVKNLGEDATPDQVRAEMDRIEAADAKADLKEMQAKPPKREALLPDLEKAEADEAAAMKAEDAEVKDSPVTPESTNQRGDLGEDILDLEDLLAPPIKGGPVEVPVIGGAGMLNPWNRASESDLRAAMLAPANARELEAMLWGQKVTETGKTGVIEYHPSVPPQQRAVMDWLHKNFLPESHIFLRADLDQAGVGGDATRLANGGLIRMNKNSLADMSVLVHEFGHLLAAHKMGTASPAIKQKMADFHEAWMKRYTGAAGPVRELPEGMPDRMGAAMERSLPNNATRWAGGWLKKQNFSMFDFIARNVDEKGRPLPTGERGRGADQAKTYWPNFDEMSAEQFVKYIEATLRQENDWKPVRIPKELADFFRKLWADFTSLFTAAKEKGYLNADASFVEFFEAVRKQAKATNTKAERAAAGKNPDRDTPATTGVDAQEIEFDPELFGTQARNAPFPARAGASLAFMQDPVAVKFGLGALPVETPRQRAEVKALIELYRKADDPQAPWNNIPEGYVKTLTDNAVFNVASTGTLMLKSSNPVARMIAATLIESTTGAAGRRPTAAIGKFMNDRRIMGNVINDVQDFYSQWRNQHGGGIWKDYTNGEHWEKFNRLVAEEIEWRRTNAKSSDNPSPYADTVRMAADKIEAAYDRARVMQIDNKTSGWASLGESSRGYMPHRLSQAKVLNMSKAEHDAYHSALVDQFVSVEGWDTSFSANLAAKYIDRARIRARGGYVVPAQVYSPGAADVVEDALKAMGMTADEVRSQMAAYTRGAAGHTKKRLELDLLQVHKDGERSFTLMDLFETDQISLLRHQGQRVSGEAALAGYGIMGKPGLDLVRRGLMFGEDNKKVEAKELDAFDQIAAEFLGDAYGTHGGKWLNRAIQFNSLARLGGMGFTQFAEGINMAAHLGVGRAVKGVAGMKRLRAEAIALARGEKVDNPILTSIEKVGGAEFGTDAYKMVFPFDNLDLQYQVSGHDTVTMADRLLRGGAQAQAKLSFWRAIHSAQNRATAEQIVHKAIRYIRDGREDIALADMGFTPEVRMAVRAQLDSIAEFDAGGNLTKFDITKMEGDEAEAFIQAVHRGTGQIIQGTYIGETGKWAHDGWLRLLTQFRTFSITSVEKQWARQRNNRGVAVALGILMGSMSAAAPIYIARVYAASIGRADREEYLEKRLAWDQVARATLNYVAMSGLAGDFADALSATTGVGKSTGGRSGGNETEFVGTVVAPAAGLADDLWRAVQNSKDGVSAHDLVKNLPFSKLPWLVPAVNLLDDN